MSQSVTEKQAFFLPYIVFAVATLFYFYDFFLGVFPSAISADLMRTYHIDAAGLGLLQAFFFTSYMPMQIPAGLLFDRFGIRKVLVTVTTICSASIFVFALTTNLYIASTMRLLMGLTSAFSYIGAVIIISLWFPKRYLPMMAGIVQVMGSVGAVVGEGPISILVQKIGMVPALIFAGIVGALIAFIFWLFIHDHPESHHHTFSEQSLNEFQKLKIVFSKPQNWWNCLFGFGIWAPMSVFSITWGVLFLRSAYHLTNEKAAILMSLIWVGIAVGGPTLGWWSGYLRKRKPSMIVGALLGLIASTMLLYMTHLPYYALYLCLFFYGMASSSQAVSFGIVDDNNSPIMAGTAIGLQNMAIVTGGITLVPFVGYWLKDHWLGNMIDGVPYYTAVEFQHILFVIPACFLLALIVSVFFLKETHCDRHY